jgi:hypothetical protein
MTWISVDHGGMPLQRPRKPPPQLYIGEWLHFLDIRPRDCSRGAQVNEGYLSQLISRKKLKASAGTLERIGVYLGIDWRKLYDPPPSREAVRAALALDPAILARFRRDND